jgi:hypothetical protein
MIKLLLFYHIFNFLSSGYFDPDKKAKAINARTLVKPRVTEK